MNGHVGLAEFLLARIAEDEAEAKDHWDRDSWDDAWLWDRVSRVLAECGAKRRILHWMGLTADEEGGVYEIAHRDALRIIATVYAGHPDYRQEWKP